MNHYILGIPNSPLHLRTGRKRRGHKAIISEYESMQSAASACIDFVDVYRPDIEKAKERFVELMDNDFKPTYDHRP